MTIARWSPRRLAAVWAAGIALQLALYVVPTAITVHLVRRDGARLRQEFIAQEARLRGSEQADSISRAEQVAAARAAGSYRIRADGETVFAIVGMPSSRPDSQHVAALRRSLRRTTTVLLGIQFGAIPLALVLLTLAWFLARRQNERPAVARA